MVEFQVNPMLVLIIKAVIIKLMSKYINDVSFENLKIGNAFKTMACIPMSGGREDDKRLDLPIY